MTAPEQQDLVSRQNLLQLQIIVGALIGGCLFFVAIAVVARLQGAFGPAEPRPIVTYLAIGFAVLALVARMIVPAAIVSGGLRRLAARQTEQPDPAETMRELWQLLTSRTIVSAALLEGATFFALIAYLVKGASLALLVAALLIVGLGTHIPTRSTAEGWIDRQRAVLQQERQWRR